MSHLVPDHYVQTLIAELLDGELTDAQQQELLSLVQADESLAQWILALFADHTLLETMQVLDSPEYFIRMILLYTQYQETGADFVERVTQATLTEEESALVDSPHAEDVERIKKIAERQLRSFMAEQERQRRQESLARVREKRFQVDPRKIVTAINRALTVSMRAVVGTAIAASVLLLLVVGVQYHRSHRVVATLGETVDVQWTEEPQAPQLRPGWLGLEGGYAQILFTSGAQVLLEGPCEFRLDGPKLMFLEGGSLSAQVPPKAVGFTVKTPSSLVRDFGTEFGVAVEGSRDTEVHVFAGEVGVRTQGGRRAAMHRLKRGQAVVAKISGSLTFGRISSSAKQFVRRLSELNETEVQVKYLNLADVVGGGNGFGTGQLDWGINPFNGRRAAFDETYGETKLSTPGFVPIPWHPFVDGVFIPNQYETPLLISHTGLTYANWPLTKGTCYTAINNGAKFGINQNSIHQGRLQGQSMGTQAYPALRMHSNVGITFDLQAIRQTIPGREITGFGAYCGISETAGRQTQAEFWVLVDGELKFQTTYTLAGSLPVNVDIALGPDSRFLTLATTDSGGVTGTDWCVFAEPALELTERE